MKNKYIAYLFFLTPVLSLQNGDLLAQEAVDPTQFQHEVFWPESSVPFIMGFRPPEVNGINIENDSERELLLGRLASVSFLWNQASTLGFTMSRDCNHGDAGFGGCPNKSGTPAENGRNEIMFNMSPPGGFGPAAGIMSPETIAAGAGGCFRPRSGSKLCLKKKFVEADVYIRPRFIGNNFANDWATTGDTSSCSEDIKTFYVENILLHEMGHALGAPHTDGRSDIMYREAPRCQNDLRSTMLTTTDKNLIRDLYGPFDQVEIAIREPVQNQTIFAGASVPLNAEAFTRSAGIESESGKSGFEIVWETGGREIASGASTTVNADEFIAGDQELTAVARSSTGARLGANSVSVELINDLLVDGEFIVFPVPCIDLAGSSDDRCMLRLKETWISGQCPFGFFDHDISAKDTLTNRKFSVIEPSYDQSPWGFGCEDHTSYDLFYGIWAVSSSDRFLLRFDHDVFRSGEWRGRNTVSGLVHKTGPVLEEFSIPDSCQIASDDAHCAVNISWSGHYFAPSSAVYFRRDSADDWIKVADMGLNAGSFQTDKIIPFSGGQFAVFQYGSDFQVPSSASFSSSSYRTLISAPAGLMAGPFTVQATVASASDASPESGLWGNSIADGAGVSLTSSSNGTRLLIWLTYENDGKAVWYMSQPAVETDGIFSAPLEKITWSDSAGSIRRTLVGNVAYAALTNDRMIFDWELDDGSNESTGSEILTHTVGGDSPTGFWNESGVANGRGFVMHSESLNGVKQNFLATLTYSGKGKPRWQFGGTAGSLIWHTRMDINENRRTVVCSTCEPVEYRLDAHPVGQVTAEFNGTATGWVNVQNLDNGEWIRGNSLNPVIFGQLTQ